MTVEASGPAITLCAKRSAVATASPEANAVAADGKAVPSAATRRLWSDIETAKNRPVASLKLSRWLVPAGLKMSVDTGHTGGAPSALERYDPANTSTNDAFS
jgi:hypothetical protein